jgi:hypothetical protein
VINNLQALIAEQPDRFTGLTTNTSAHVVIYLVDPTAAEQGRFRSILRDAQRENINVALTPGQRSLRMLTQIMDDITRGRVFPGKVRLVSWGIDAATAAVQVTVAARSVEEARRACAHYDGAVMITAVDRSAFGMLPGYRGSREGGQSRQSGQRRESRSLSRRWPAATAPKASRSRSSTPTSTAELRPTCAPTASGCSSMTVSSSTPARADQGPELPVDGPMTGHADHRIVRLLAHIDDAS